MFNNGELKVFDHKFDSILADCHLYGPQRSVVGLAILNSRMAPSKR